MRQAIETKYLPYTNHRGSRIKAIAQAGSVTVPWKHELSVNENHHLAAETLAKKLGWYGEWYGGGNAKGTGHVYIMRKAYDYECQIVEYTVHQVTNSLLFTK